MLQARPPGTHKLDKIRKSKTLHCFNAVLTLASMPCALMDDYVGEIFLSVSVLFP